MQTDKIVIDNHGTGIEAALNETEKFAVYVGLSPKQALQMRLLAEETVGMVQAITGEFEASFWLESKKNHICRIHLVAETEMDADKKSELIDVSSNKKNASAKGFMGKIREMMEIGVSRVDEMESLSAEYGNTYVMYGTLGMYDTETLALNSCIYQWSLEKYRRKIGEEMEDHAEAAAAWDELEKSIVAKLADDVRVGVKGDTVELVIEKKMAG